MAISHPFHSSLGSQKLPPRRTKAFSLVEVVVALGILAFVIVAILGLFVLAVRSGGESAETTSAANLASLIINQRRIAPVDGPGATLSKLDAFALPELNQNADNFTSNGTLTSPVYINKDGFTTPTASNADYGILYKVTPSSNTRYADVYLMIYWPPLAGPQNATGRYETGSRILLP